MQLFDQSTLFVPTVHSVKSTVKYFQHWSIAIVIIIVTTTFAAITVFAYFFGSLPVVVLGSNIIEKPVSAKTPTLEAVQ